MSFLHIRMKNFQVHLSMHPSLIYMELACPTCCNTLHTLICLIANFNFGMVIFGLQNQQWLSIVSFYYTVLFLYLTLKSLTFFFSLLESCARSVHRGNFTWMHYCFQGETLLAFSISYLNVSLANKQANLKTCKHLLSMLVASCCWAFSLLHWIKWTEQWKWGLFQKILISSHFKRQLKPPNWGFKKGNDPKIIITGL